MKDIITLGIESSCDETSVSVVKNGREVLSNVIASQIDIHKKYGGVVPEIASRHHVEAISSVFDEAIDDAQIKLEDIDCIGVTYGPGLVGALLVGLSYAKGLSFSLGKPLVGVNHIEGHISANFIDNKELKPPFLCLVVSGGHSHLVYVKDYTEFEILGKTRDDAVGEAFDKVARVVGLGYPGGPLVDEHAKQGVSEYNFPKTHFDNLDFSFSGIKTAVINFVNKNKDYNLENLCASFQTAVVEVLLENTLKAAKQLNINKIAIAGGVAANSFLRAAFDKQKNNYEIYYPSLKLCTDNAAMIAASAYFRYTAGYIADFSLNAVPNLKIGENKYYVNV